MFDIFLIIAPLFVIIFGTAFLRYIHFIKEDWTIHLNQYALKIGLPVLVFTSLATMQISLINEISLIIENSIFIFVIFLFSYTISKIFRFTTRMRYTIITCLMFSNVAYLGIPVLTQVYNTSVLPQISIIVAVYLLGLFGLGIAYLEMSQRTSKKSVFRTIATAVITNPLLIAVLSGILVNIFHIPIAPIISKALQLIVGSVTPIVLIVIGVFIGQSPRGTIRDWYGVALFSCATLLILPALFYGGVFIYDLSPSFHYLSILESAMPLGITPFALADQYGLDKNFIARSIVLSTALSIVTLPFWISLLT